MIKKLTLLLGIAIATNTSESLNAMNWDRWLDRFNPEILAPVLEGKGRRTFPHQEKTEFTHATGAVAGQTTDILPGGVRKFPDRHSAPGFEHNAGTPYRPEYQINDLEELSNSLCQFLRRKLVIPGITINNISLTERDTATIINVEIFIYLRTFFIGKIDRSLQKLQQNFELVALPELHRSIAALVSSNPNDQSIRINIIPNFRG